MPMPMEPRKPTTANPIHQECSKPRPQSLRRDIPTHGHFGQWEQTCHCREFCDDGDYRQYDCDVQQRERPERVPSDFEDWREVHSVPLIIKPAGYTPPTKPM